MPHTDLGRTRAGQNRTTVLQAWAATSGCWSGVGVLWPDSVTALWAAFALGCLIAGGSAAVSRRIGRSGIANVPMLIALMAAAAAAHIVALQAPSTAMLAAEGGTKATITAALLIAYLADQLTPTIIRRIRRFLGEVLREELGEADSVHRNGRRRASR
jgi:hypothetical protein